MPTYVALLRVPPEGVEQFRAYERFVLPLLTRHNGKLLQRLRSKDGLSEVHLLEFATPSGLAEYRADPERTRHAHLFDASGAIAELFEVEAVPPKD